jgi:tetratricopeptide (TPR) repeat protein
MGGMGHQATHRVTAVVVRRVDPSRASTLEAREQPDIGYRPIRPTPCGHPQGIDVATGPAVWGRWQEELLWWLAEVSTAAGGGNLCRSGWREMRTPRQADRFVLEIGLACVLGAIVAGGLKVAGVELPVISSLARQLLLAAVGVLLTAASLVVRTRDSSTIDHDEVAARPVVPVPGVIPPATRYFTGRQQLLEELDRLLATEGVVVLAGLGGVGKTQLAVHWLRNHEDGLGLVWWVRGERAVTITEDLAALADQRQLCEASASLADKLAATRHWLEQTPGWLLVFDDATSPATLTPYLPTGGRGRVLVTSRRPHWPYATMDVRPWPRGEAEQFLTAHSPTDVQSARGLAELLGELPLALEQARAYLAATPHQSPVTYLAQLRRELAGRTGGLLAAGEPAHYQATVATTWAVALRRMRRTPGTAGLLRLLAFLAPEPVPMGLFTGHPRQLPWPLRWVAADQARFARAVAVLDRFSLVTDTKQGIVVHRLVQAVVRQALGRWRARRWAGSAVRLVDEAFPSDSQNPVTWPICAELLPHALTVTETTQALGTHREDTRSVLTKAGSYLWGRAELDQAEVLFERALAIDEAFRFIPFLSDTATGLSNLAGVLADQGDLDRARTLYERARSIRQSRLRPNRPDIAWTLTNLATVLHRQGDVDRARALHERALAIFETRLGKDHPDTAWSLSGLADVLHRQGDPERARALHQRALSIREAHLGPDHPITASSLSSLAGVLHAQGDLDAARALHQRALSIREAHLGPDHPITASSLSSLAGVLYAQDELDAARRLYERALSIREARLGKDHLTIAWSLSSLADVLAGQDDLDGARRLYERALSIYENRLGPDHPDTATALSSLADVLYDQDELDAARRLYERALSIREARLGPDHPQSAATRQSLAALRGDRAAHDEPARGPVTNGS